MHQNALAPILILLIAAGVLALGAAGWLYTRNVRLAHDQFAETRTQLNQTSSNPVDHRTTSITTSTEPPVVGASSTRQDTSKWRAYYNEKYGFEFRYPPEFNVFASLEGSDDDQSADIVVNGEKALADRLPEQLYIDILDPAMDIRHYDLPAKFWHGPLDDVVQRLWQLAQHDELVGPIATSSLGGQLAYEWTASNGIGVNGRGRVIDEQHLWLFTQKNGLVFELSFPETNKFLQIVSTFQYAQ